MTALPMPPRKVTELVPLPEHPAQVKVPEVENVTGSALASAIPSDTTTRSNALMMVALKTPVMFVLPTVSPRRTSAPTLREGTLIGRHDTRLRADVSHSRGATATAPTCLEHLRYFFAKRRRKPAAAPMRPVPNRTMLAGSGTV